MGKDSIAQTADREKLFEEYPVSKSIFILAAPTIISQLINTVYNLADTFWVGRLNDPYQLAALAVTFPTQIILTAIGNLFGIGAGTCISRKLGAKDNKGASQAASFGLLGGIITAAVYLFVLGVFRPQCLSLLGSAPAIEVYANDYLNWAVGFGGLFTVYNLVIASMIRGEGMSRQASFGLSMGGILNIVLDPLFVLPSGFGLEVKGAAIATLLSNVISSAYFAGTLWKYRKVSSVALHPRFAFASGSICREVFFAGIPSALQAMLSAISNMVLNSLMIRFGESAEAAIGITKKIDAIPLGILTGLVQGTVPLIAYNYGADNKARMKQTLKTSMAFCFALSLVILVVIEFFAVSINKLFIQETDTIQYGAGFLRLHCASIPFLSFNSLIMAYFQATSRNKQAFFLSIIRKGILDIPVMYLLNVLLPMYGLIATQPIMDVIAAICAAVMLMRCL